MRALALETEYDKEEILQSYLEHRSTSATCGGLAIHGFGTAARVYFSKPAESLTLAEAAALAAMIQAPNRLSPIEHATALRKRRDWVLVAHGRARLGDAGGRRARQGRSRCAQAVAAGSTAPHQFISWIAER